MAPSREHLIAVALRPLPPNGPARVAAERMLEQVVPTEHSAAERVLARWEMGSGTLAKRPGRARP